MISDVVIPIPSLKILSLSVFDLWSRKSRTDRIRLWRYMRRNEFNKWALKTEQLQDQQAHWNVALRSPNSVLINVGCSCTEPAVLDISWIVIKIHRRAALILATTTIIQATLPIDFALFAPCSVIAEHELATVVMHRGRVGSVSKRQDPWSHRCRQSVRWTGRAVQLSANCISQR